MTATEVYILLLVIAVCKLFVDSARMSERVNKLEDDSDKDTKTEAAGFEIADDSE